jgi:26S proteasome regulatory subunit N2
LDILEHVLGLSRDSSLLAYVLDAAMTVVPKIELRNKVLRLLVRLYSSDYFAITQCCVHLNDSGLATDLLRDLLKSNDEDKTLIAYQVAFDLVEMATQEFLTNVRDALGGGSEEKQDASGGDTGTGMEVDKPQAQAEPGSTDNVETVRRILTGVDAVKLYLEFLYRNNHADFLILKKTKVRVVLSCMVV